VDTLTATFGAFADPTRRSLLRRLAGGPVSVCELARPFRITQQAVSKHLAYLERAGLIVKRSEGRQHFCALQGDSFREAAEWVQNYRQFWEERLDRMDDYLMELQRKGKKSETKT
jgi:DNA-binding transcriptional ArsR family regulator